MCALRSAIKYLVLLFILVQRSAASCRGCVELDEITFDKMVKKFAYTIVKFDIAYPYGDKHEAFSTFAQEVSPNVDDLLIALVGVKDYGEMENKALAEKYKVEEKKFPKILLFKGGSTEDYIEYPSDWELTNNNLKKFLRERSGLYIGLDGCIQSLDIAVEGFVDLTKEQQEKTLEKVNKLVEKLESEKDQENAKVYVMIMKRVIEKGPSFLKDEQRRIANLLKQKVSAKKKVELERRVNILESFSRSNSADDTKDEL